MDLDNFKYSGIDVVIKDAFVKFEGYTKGKVYSLFMPVPFANIEGIRPNSLYLVNDYNDLIPYNQHKDKFLRHFTSDAQRLAVKVKEMRDAQKEYFATRNRNTLERSKQLEREADGLVKAILKNSQLEQQGGLFNQKIKNKNQWQKCITLLVMNTAKEAS